MSASSYTPLLIAVAVFWGGALGAVCRVLTNALMMHMLGEGNGFPYGILSINICGSLLMGLLVGSFRRLGTRHPLINGLFGTGFLGGFTTFSTVSVNTLTLFLHGSPAMASLNILLNTALSVCAAGVGYVVMAPRSRPRPAP